jgi:type III secretion system HrpE/YscL family protein
VSLAILHLDDQQRLLLDATRVDKAAFRALRDCEAAVAAAAAAGERIREHAEQNAREAYEQAQMRGFEAGRVEGVIAVLGTLDAEQRLRELLSDRLAALVEHCVRSILADFGADEVFRRRTLQLIRAGAPGGSAILHVCPSQTQAVQRVLQSHAQATGAQLSWLTVQSDEGCEPDTLVLETEVGFIDASLALTLDGVHAMIGKAVQRAAAQLGL